MTTDSNTTPEAVGSPVERGVGRLVPERAAIPPAAWDQWAMRKANEVYDRTVMHHIGNDCRCRAAIHVALVDAMRFAVTQDTEEWRAMLYAPRDGTKVELLIEHRTWWAAYKCSPDEARMWRSNCEGQWIDHNGGGWTWAGMSGTPIGWRPLKTPNR